MRKEVRDDIQCVRLDLSSHAERITRIEQRNDDSERERARNVSDFKAAEDIIYDTINGAKSTLLNMVAQQTSERNARCNEKHEGVELKMKVWIGAAVIAIALSCISFFINRYVTQMDIQTAHQHEGKK